MSKADTEMITAKITGNQVKVWNENDAQKIHRQKYYGKLEEEHLELSLCEAYHLLKRKIVELVDENGEKIGKEQTYQKFSDLDAEFDYKYTVYEDLRDRGYIVKSGFKYGVHFRVYERGVNPYEEGSKQNRQHTKWVVSAVPESKDQKFYEVSKSVRLAQNIRARMLYAVVDDEKDVTYYETTRKTL